MADNSSSSTDLWLLFCEDVSTSTKIMSAIFAVRAILLLPLCTVVLYISHRQRRQQLSFTTTSHADMFTYNMVAMQMIWFLSSVCFIGGKFANVLEVKILGFCLSLVDFYGEIMFHMLTCVERYLAVVQPITYLKLKQARGIRIRNISIGCAWLLSFTLMGVSMNFRFPSHVFLCILVFSITVVSFCSLSILCVLIRPGPGEGSANKERVDQSKQRAFCTVATIMGLLCLWFVGFLIATILGRLPQIDSNVSCGMISAVGFFNLPCSVLLPLLYLHRARKLPCCC